MKSTDTAEKRGSMKRKANGRRERRLKATHHFVPTKKEAGGNGFTHSEKRTLWYAKTSGMLWAFESAVRESAYQMPDGVERSYLDFFKKAMPGDPGASDYLKDGFEKEVRFLIHAGVVAVIADGTLRTFIAIREHYECGHFNGVKDDKRRTRFGYTEGAGEFFLEMSAKRRIGDFTRGMPC